VSAAITFEPSTAFTFGHHLEIGALDAIWASAGTHGPKGGGKRHIHHLTQIINWGNGLCSRHEQWAFPEEWVDGDSPTDWECVFGVGLDGHVHFGAGFEADLIAVFVGQSVVNPDLTIEMVGTLNTNLSFFGHALMRRLNDFFDHSGESGTGLFRHGFILRAVLGRTEFPGVRPTSAGGLQLE
jgi:hypothetical protein